MELIGKLGSSYISNIGMLPSASKDISIKFADQCLHILNNKEIFNGLKGRTNIQKRESLFKYQSRIYIFQRNSDVNHRDMKIIWNKKLFPPLNFINGKIFPYARKVILRNYHYWSDPKLVPGIVAII